MAPSNVDLLLKDFPELVQRVPTTGALIVGKTPPLQRP
jgi:hypothetical protein